METRTSLLFVATLFAVLIIPASDAFAHKIGIFAAYDGEEVAGEVYSSGGGRLAGWIVRVEDGSAEALEVKTDDEGKFRFKPRTTNDHLLVVDTSDGHRAEFRIPAAELSDATVEADAASAEPAPPDLDRRIARAVAREVAALRRDLDRQNRQARLRDIIGAIGYIFGVAGILMMIKARSRSGPHDR